MSKFFRSVRFKAILLYMFMLALTLSVFSVIIYEGFSKTLYDDLDDLLSSRAEGVANSIDAYLQAGPPSSDSAFASSARDWVEEKRKDPDLMSIFVQILDTKARPIISSKGMPTIESISKDDLEDILDGDEDFDTVTVEMALGKKEKFRVYTKPVMEDEKVIYIVQAGGPISLLSLALNNLRFIFFIILPLTIILAALPGVFLVRLTLRPVDTMVKTLRQITAENLKLKIHLPDTKDEIRRLADTFNDMIERLDRSFSSQQRFIKDISQELKKPVSALKEELEAALEKNCSTEEYKSLLLRALKETDGFSRIIENLLFLSQFNSNNQMTLEIRKINMGQLVGGVVEEMRELMEEKGLSILLSSSNDIVLDGDKSQLIHMVMNLLGNAIKYTYRNGRISITVSKVARNAEIIIGDTGIGIPEDELPYIFDRFYQVAKSRRATGRGFGLGLSTVKSIVEAHKGSIAVESRVGKGSTFTVSLPLSYPG